MRILTFAAFLSGVLWAQTPTVQPFHPARRLGPPLLAHFRTPRYSKRSRSQISAFSGRLIGVYSRHKHR